MWQGIARRMRREDAPKECFVIDMMRRQTLAVAAIAGIALSAGQAQAAQCGNSAAGFETWKRAFSEEARGRASAASLAALQNTSYSAATISADRGQHSFKLSLEQFLAKRGGPAIVSKGRVLKRQNAALFDSIEQRYGVPPGPLLAIWGMETGFGAVRGNVNTLSAVATLAYDCRRSAHGEVGHTQFLPKNVLTYGTGDLNNVGAALSSTANFLKAHGWRAGAGYQPGEPNFAAIQGWNAAPVYERAIAILGRQIDND
jgi:membrane-bound lytic murein transglycosylase B